MTCTPRIAAIVARVHSMTTENFHAFPHHVEWYQFPILCSGSIPQWGLVIGLGIYSHNWPISRPSTSDVGDLVRSSFRNNTHIPARQMWEKMVPVFGSKEPADSG